MFRLATRNRGFGLLEFIIACSISALLVAISMPLYQDYSARAQATEIVLLYDELRSGMRADLEQGIVDNCFSLRSSFSDTGKIDGYDANIEVSFDVVSGGFKPVMLVTATRLNSGALGMSVANAAYEQFTELGVVNQSHVFSVLITFSVNLSDTSGPDCLRIPKP